MSNRRELKFKDIKAGDTIFEEKFVSTGYNKGRYFFIPTKVVRVTKTQFVTESGNRYHKDGRGHGYTRGKALLEGEKIGFLKDRIVTDQTKEYNDFLDYKKVSIQVRNRLEDVSRLYNIECGLEYDELVALNRSLELIYEKLKNY